MILTYADILSGKEFGTPLSYDDGTTLGLLAIVKLYSEIVRV